ncbi:hypothetical protein ACQR16_05990 [Bradyrhizobium oligotrophicum]|uniref:hypothetical protein n=1 Tax=Bradyrhizobium oligotrophicum TaxID=44255 RepID=UPI003EC13F15
MASMGIFRVSEVTKALRDNMQSLVDRGLLDPRNVEEFAAANNYAAKQMEDLAEQARVAGSLLPQFQSALNEVGNARKQLDSALVEGMGVNRNFFAQFGQQIRQGANAWDAFKSAGLNALGTIADKLAQMAADKLFASALGGSGGGLLSLLGIGGGDSGTTMGSINVGDYVMPTVGFKAANGGTFGPGWGVVGERGPELIKVNRNNSVTVIPNHISRPYLPGFADGGSLDAGGGVRRLPFGGREGGTVNAPVTVSIDARGADKDGLERVKNELAQLKAELPSRIVSTVTNARKTRQL